MKKTFIADLQPAGTIDDIFVLSDKVLSQKKDGNNYLNIGLSDKTGSIKGVVWDNVDEILNSVSTGDIVHVQGLVNAYRGELQLVVKKLNACPPDTVDAKDFLAETEHDIDGMFDRLKRLTGEMKDPDFRALMDAFWQDSDFSRRFKTAPAAKKMHHAYIGGLLEHTLSMALLVERIAGHYTGIDMDLLLAGAVLHDIGKIREYEYTFNIDYSDEGRLLSHIVIGLKMVDKKLEGIENFPDKKAFLLKHMIVSHHGARDFGSVEPPKTLEAVLLNYIDEIDSKINGIRVFMASEDPDAVWTSYHRILGRHFYKGDKE